MRRRNFDLRLERVLNRTVVEAAVNPQAIAGGKKGIDQTDKDPKLKQQQKEAERQGTNKAGAAQLGGASPAQQPTQQAPDQRAQQEKQRQLQQGTQLSTSMAELDKQIAKLQAKIQGGAVKPAELGQLNQLLTAKKSVQDKYMRLSGVNPSS